MSRTLNTMRLLHCVWWCFQPQDTSKTVLSGHMLCVMVFHQQWCNVSHRTKTTRNSLTVMNGNYHTFTNLSERFRKILRAFSKSWCVKVEECHSISMSDRSSNSHCCNDLTVFRLNFAVKKQHLFALWFKTTCLMRSHSLLKPLLYFQTHR